MPEYKIIVTDSDKCIKLLQFINDQIEAIVQSTGYFIKIEKIDRESLDGETLQALKKRGISALPVAVSPSGKVIPGAASVIKLFSGRIKTTSRQNGITTSDMGNDPQLADFYAKEMFEIKGGVVEKRTDPEDEMGDGDKDIQRKMNNFKKPDHWNQEGGRTKQKRRKPARSPSQSDESMEDNIGHDEPAPGGDMDSQMMAAWLNNNAN